MSNLVLLNELYCSKAKKTVGGYPFERGEVVEVKAIYMETDSSFVRVSTRCGTLEIDPNDFVKNFKKDEGEDGYE